MRSRRIDARYTDPNAGRARSAGQSVLAELARAEALGSLFGERRAASFAVLRTGAHPLLFLAGILRALPRLLACGWMRGMQVLCAHLFVRGGVVAAANARFVRLDLVDDLVVVDS